MPTKINLGKDNQTSSKNSLNTIPTTKYIIARLINKSNLFLVRGKHIRYKRRNPVNVTNTTDIVDIWLWLSGHIKEIRAIKRTLITIVNAAGIDLDKTFIA